MKKILTVYSLLFVAYCSAQEDHMYVPKPLEVKYSSSEVGIFLGASYYNGDLNPSKQFDRFTRPAAGVLYRMNFNPRVAVKGIVSFGNIAGDDAYATQESQRNRNLSFKSRIYEFAVEGEFNFLPYATGSKKLAIMTPYVFAGVAVFHFDPLGYYQGRWYDLHSLSTEGQGTAFSGQKMYSLTQFSIPFGVGVKVNTAKRVGINLEWGLRKTFTDYLDDVSGNYVDPVLLGTAKGPVAAALSDKSLVKEGGSDIGRQRGNANTKDWYTFAGVIITLKLNGNANACVVPH